MIPMRFVLILIKHKAFYDRPGTIQEKQGEGESDGGHSWKGSDHNDEEAATNLDDDAGDKYSKMEAVNINASQISSKDDLKR